MNMRKMISIAIAIAALAFCLTPSGHAAERGNPHRVAIQIDQNDPDVMNLVLNNASNVIDYYRGRGEDVEIEIVAYSGGLHMLRDDTSPVKDRIRRLTETSFPAKIAFAACGNTKEGMEKREGRSVTLIPQASIVPAGVVRLMELQEKGWSYVRP
jgi:intracellular sulfur oxidation DsrE/DsrF family protein